jgi:hypothetical protein
MKVQGFAQGRLYKEEEKSLAFDVALNCKGFLGFASK